MSKWNEHTEKCEQNGKEMQNEIDRYENYNLLIFTQTTTTNRVS